MKETKPLTPMRSGLEPKLPPLHKRYTKQEVIDCIHRNYGVVTICCCDLDCSFSQFYRGLDHYQLHDELAKARESIISLAEKAIVDCLKSEDEKVRLQAAQTTLKLGGQKFGWSSAPQVNVQTQVNVIDKDAQIRELFGLE